MTYPVEVVNSSFFDKVIVIIETCRVVSILQQKIQAFMPISSEEFHICTLNIIEEYMVSYGSRPSSRGSQTSVISVDPIVVF